MEIVKRERYLEKIRPYMNTPTLKILTGMRRVGKSTLLFEIRDEVLVDVDEEHKIYIDFESVEYQKVTDYDSLRKVVRAKLPKDKKRTYLFFDGIQFVEGWERFLLDLTLNKLLDVYITVSNASVLTSDIFTVLACWYVEINIQPYVFSEFMNQYAYLGLSEDELFKQYINIGGMPMHKYIGLEDTSAFQLRQDSLNTIVVKNVMMHNQIRDVHLLNKILDYVVKHIGDSSSATQIRNDLKSEKTFVSVDTVLDYLDYLCDAYVIQRVNRYDVLENKVLKTREKYYLTDHGFRSALGYSNEKEIERVLENMVYIELISRGYKVYSGKVGVNEIDFVAKKDDKIEYYQVTYVMESENTRNREFGVYELIPDNYLKYVLSMDRIDFSQNGVKHLNIIDFLSESYE